MARLTEGLSAVERGQVVHLLGARLSVWSDWLGEGVTSVTARSLPTLALRLAISALSAALCAWQIGPTVGGIWALGAASAEAGVWITSRPQRTATPTTKAQRLAYVAAVAWMNIVWWSLVLILWTSGQEALRLAGVCLLAALLVHAQAFASWSKLLLLIVGGGAAVVLVALCLLANDYGAGERVVVVVAALMLVTYTAQAAATNVRRGRAVEAARAQAERANAAKSEFLALMSHELRTPLNAMLGIAQTLTLEPLTPRVKDQVELIEEGGRTLLALLNDVLDLAKIEAGKLEIAPTTDDLAALCDRVVRLHLPLAAEKGTTIDLIVDPSVPPALVFDPLRVRQCLANLVSNAVKFTLAGQVLVRVSCAPAADPEGLVVKVTVSDTGVGMDAATLARLFKPFEQGDAATARHTGGTGLGLSITRRLANLMGGDVTVRSAVGKGATVVLTFTCAAREAPAQPAATDPATSKRVLVVDDYTVNRKVVVMMLAPLGCQIAEAANGQSALALLEAQAFDVVLIDFNMPVMGGLEATRRIRAQAALRDLPVICLTAGITEAERADAIAVGMTGFIEKPIDMRSLVAAVERCPRRTS